MKRIKSSWKLILLAALELLSIPTVAAYDAAQQGYKGQQDGYNQGKQQGYDQQHKSEGGYDGSKGYGKNNTDSAITLDKTLTIAEISVQAQTVTITESKTMTEATTVTVSEIEQQMVTVDQTVTMTATVTTMEIFTTKAFQLMTTTDHQVVTITESVSHVLSPFHLYRL
ncbi:hypothetical protein K432DRAFT_407249 [Lepidopterella palustris CBS 459.81]|uniref:Uncharacterized protein n=1 Tax=Lepidopterella palustris CBS 459.81 TaxID=1314670 RepID=A0A8E2JD03_9PEZI|nr:hypothetical protein K432DRAFT_407249 [Lepidopterella palustris CBS 459.81]